MMFEQLPEDNFKLYFQISISIFMAFIDFYQQDALIGSHMF